MIAIYNHCIDEGLVNSIIHLCLLLSENGYYEESSDEFQALLNSNFLISYIERTEQKIELIKLEYAGKKLN